MISVDRDEILLRLAGIPAVTLHKLHPAITCKKFNPGKTGSLFSVSTAGIPVCQDEIFPYNRFSPPKRDEKVN